MSIRMTPQISEPARRPLGPPAEPSHAAYRPTPMSTQQMSRGAVAAATAAMLGARLLGRLPLRPGGLGRTPRLLPDPDQPRQPRRTREHARHHRDRHRRGRRQARHPAPGPQRPDPRRHRGQGPRVGQHASPRGSSRPSTRNGVAGKDIQTSNLQVQPEYSYPTNGSPVIKGYTVSEGVTATLRNLGKSGNAISAAVTAGGNAVQVNGISLDLEDNGKLLSTARDQAVANAKTKAEQYAKASGRDLGAVVSISETVSDPPPVGLRHARHGQQGQRVTGADPGRQRERRRDRHRRLRLPLTRSQFEPCRRRSALACCRPGPCPSCSSR